MIEQNNLTTIRPVPVTASKRFASALIDYIPVMMISFVASTIGMAMFFESFQLESYIQPDMTDEDAFAMFSSMFDSMSSIILPSSIAMAIGNIYFLCKDLIGGRSPGKRLQKLQLVRLDGSPVSYTRMVVRNMLIIIWPVELIMYLANSGQRLGDLLCKTTVVVATEENKQPTDVQKVIIAVIIVTIFASLISVFYYWGMEAFFDWYMRFLQGIMQHSMNRV